MLQSVTVLHSTLFKVFCVIFRNNNVFHFLHDSTVCNNPVAPDMLVEVSYAGGSFMLVTSFTHHAFARAVLTTQ